MDFAIAALPRSGTTWASIWLMDGALCLHDPLATMTTADLAQYNPGRRWGIACTGIWLFPEFLAQAKCPVVLLDNNIESIQLSLSRIGFAPLQMELVERFDLLNYPRFETSDMFEDEDVAEEIWNTLRPDQPMDHERWRLLREIQAEPDFSFLKFDEKHVRKLSREVAGGMR
jgi:hypothetical protein